MILLLLHYFHLQEKEKTPFLMIVTLILTLCIQRQMKSEKDVQVKVLTKNLRMINNIWT